MYTCCRDLQLKGMHEVKVKVSEGFFVMSSLKKTT